MKTIWFAPLFATALLTTVLLPACGSEQVASSDEGGTGLGPGFGGGGDASTDGTGDRFAGCLTSSKKAEKIPVDMVIGLDTSFSMDFDEKWTNVRDAMKSFVQNPAYSDLRIGLQFFPIRKLCSATAYATPAVALALRANVAASIEQALDAQTMADGTPMVPLLQGLTTYMRGNAQVGRRPVIVLATDGVPDDKCVGGSTDSLPNTLENAVLVAGEAKTGSPSIATFVIGVGGELAALNAIGQAGGTGNALLVDTSGNTQAAFLEALDSIRRQAIPCDYAIPETIVDATKTNVTYTPAGGAPQTFGFVGNAEGCAKAPESGWYFDDENAPHKVILCAATCDIVKKDDLGQVDVLFGCPRFDVR